MRFFSKMAAVAFAFAMALALVACSGGAGGSASSSASGGSASTSAAGGASFATSGQLVGKPWVTSILQGNLPAEQPELKNDLYTYYNYDYLAAHQTQTSSVMRDYAGDLSAANLAVIKDTSKSGHDLDQLRIFFEQASDIAALKERGLADLQPYLDRIDAVTSIEEMNGLLSADDFPFSPFVMAEISLSDTRDVNIVTVTANLALVDTIMVGGAYYQDADDPQAQQIMETALMSSAAMAMIDLAAVGIDDESAKQMLPSLVAFEKAHGRYVDYSGKYSMRDFGAMAEAARESLFTLDEMCAACPNFPMKATLDRMGKGSSPRYCVSGEWLKAFNEVWKTDNIEVIKTIAKMQLLAETRAFRDPTLVNQVRTAAGRPALEGETFAYEACDKLDTFSILFAKTYVDEGLGSNAKFRLTELTQQLISTYKDLVKSTPWLSEASRQRIIEKLDHMTLNVLEPAGGYYDFSGLELTPTDQGGTLIGNYLKLKQYHLDQESKMIGQPAVAASAWFQIKPTMMNAYYETTSNSINILPGFVTSFVYADDMSEQDLLAGIGFTIGHEISHGFDYQGAQFDAYGTPTPAFADEDVDAFVLKATTLASYYNEIEIAPGVMVNGTSVVTEAAADLCGMQVVLERAEKIEGVDYNRFFSRFAGGWAEVVPEAMLPSLIVDAHTLSNHRINVNSQMFAPMYEALGVSEGDAMYLASDKRINIWGPNA